MTWPLMGLGLGLGLVPGTGEEEPEGLAVGLGEPFCRHEIQTSGERVTLWIAPFSSRRKAWQLAALREQHFTQSKSVSTQRSGTHGGGGGWLG